MTIEDIVNEMTRGNAQTSAVAQVPAELTTAPQEEAARNSTAQEQAAPPTTGADIARLMNPVGQYARTSEQYYQDIYDQVRANGGTADQAHRLAAQKAAPYQANRVAALADAFNSQGVTADGQITNAGASMLSQIANENPAQANLLANMYGTPKQGYGFMLDIAKQNNSAENHLNNAEKMAGVNYGYSQQAADAQLQRQMALADFTNSLGMQQKIALMQAAPEIKFNLAKQFGLSDMDAAVYALGVGGSGRGSRNERGGDEKNEYKYLRDWIKDYESRYRDPMTGKFMEGRGEADAEYADRLARLNDYSAKKYDSTDYNDEVRFAQAMLDSGQYTKEAIRKYIIENFEDADAVIDHLGL